MNQCGHSCENFGSNSARAHGHWLISHCRSVTAARETGFYQDSSPHLEHNSGRGVVLPKYLTTGEVRSNQALQCIFGGVKHISMQCQKEL